MKVDDDYRPEFVGNWMCFDNTDFIYVITIDKNSNAIYEEIEYGGGDKAKIKGKARANNNKLKIGRFTDFKIIDYPHKIDTATSNIIVDEGHWMGKSMKANWAMKLKGHSLYMGDGTYYKADY